MPELSCYYIDSFNLDIKECFEDMFGFYYCKVKVCDIYLDLLPYRYDDSLIILIGEFEDWYLSV